MRLFRIALVAAIALIAPAGAWTPAESASFFVANPEFRVTWEAAQTKRGQPIIQGYVYNTSTSAASDIRVRIESLDAEGRTIAETVAPLFGDTQPGGRSYFELPVRTPGVSYRVTVVSFRVLRGA